MNPLEPNDPLWKLLGKSRDVEVRSNFAQNAARAARNTPQERSWWSRLRSWWEDSTAPMPMRGLIATAAIVTLAGWVSVSLLRDEVAAPQVALTAVPAATSTAPHVVEIPLVPEVETQLESLDYLDALLALEDTSSLTDKEIAYLLY